MGSGFIEDVEALEERVKREIGENVLMQLYIEDYRKNGVEISILEDMYRAQIEMIKKTIDKIGVEKERVKKKAYAEGISYADVQDALSIVTTGIEYLQGERERYRERVSGRK